jgi:flagellar basal body-associated protein FliL
MIKNKKGGTSISILLLVVMALILSAMTLLVFLTSRGVEKKISNARLIENVYVKEEQINFLLKRGVGLEEAVKLVEGTKLVGDEVEITEKIEAKDSKISVVYRFKPEAK